MRLTGLNRPKPTADTLMEIHIKDGGATMNEFKENHQTENLLTRTEAAAFLRLKPQTLAAWSTRGTGPKICKLGGRVLYRMEDLQAYITDCTTPRK